MAPKERGEAPTRSRSARRTTHAIGVALVNGLSLATGPHDGGPSAEAQATTPRREAVAKDVPPPPRRSLADYKFLVSIAALGPTILHTADNMTSYCLAYWAPTYFMEVFELSSTATGAFLGSTHLISMAGCVIAPMAEILVRKMGASHKQMRRIMSN